MHAQFYRAQTKTLTITRQVISARLLNKADWAAWIMDNCRFDQLLVEKSGSAVWLHVSCKRDLSKNRQTFKVVRTK